MNKISENNPYKDYVKKFWICFGGGIAAVFLFFLLANWGVFGAMPTFDQ